MRGLGYTLDIDQPHDDSRSVTSRLVFFYCLLLVVLGGAFLLFTVLSFQHYTRETVASNLAARTQEIWNIGAGRCWISRERLADVIERRFAPESQDRFIRIRAGGQLIYRSGDPVERRFFGPGRAPAQVPDNARRRRNLIGNLLLYSRNFRQRGRQRDHDRFAASPIGSPARCSGNWQSRCSSACRCCCCWRRWRAMS